MTENTIVGDEFVKLRYTANERDLHLIRFKVITKNKTALGIYECFPLETGKPTSIEVQELVWQQSRDKVIAGRPFISRTGWRNPSNEQFGKIAFSYPLKLKEEFLRKFDSGEM